MTRRVPQARLLNVPQLAAELGFSESAVKKWRGHTIAALRAAGQLYAEAPTVLLPTNALPLPANQAEHARSLRAKPRVEPLWALDVVEKWARRTERKDPVTGETTHPSPPGRTPDPNKPPRVRRRPQPIGEQYAAVA